MMDFERGGETPEGWRKTSIETRLGLAREWLAQPDLLQKAENTLGHFLTLLYKRDLTKGEWENSFKPGIFDPFMPVWAQLQCAFDDNAQRRDEVLHTWVKLYDKRQSQSPTTPLVYAALIPRIYQYIALLYPSYENITQIARRNHKRLVSLGASGGGGEVVEEFCTCAREYFPSTNILPRYVTALNPIFYAMRAVTPWKTKPFSSQPHFLGDFGSGPGYGFPAAYVFGQEDEVLNQVEIRGMSDEENSAMLHPVQMMPPTMLLRLDITHDPIPPLWGVASGYTRFVPSLLKQMEEVAGKSILINKGGNIQYRQFNMGRDILPKEYRSKLDIAMMAASLYLLGPGERKHAIEHALLSIRPGGVLLIVDTPKVFTDSGQEEVQNSLLVRGEMGLFALTKESEQIRGSWGKPMHQDRIKNYQLGTYYKVDPNTVDAGYGLEINPNVLSSLKSYFLRSYRSQQ